MARRFWPGEDAIGKRISFIGPQGPYAKVIGVAKDGKYRRLGESPQPYMYLPFYQSFHQLHHANMTLHIRTDGDPVKMMLAVQSEVLAVDKNLPVPEIKSLTEHMGQPLWAARMGASLFGIFGFLALLLAAVGIYGVMAYSVTRRTQEIGIRMALGAQPLDILKLVVRQGMTLVLIGVAIGLAGAWVVMRVLSSFFYGVSPTDLVTYTGVAVLLTGVALLASFIPARRATKVDPMVALRYE
jgi:putative ABC transport system permease protein